MRCCDKEVNLLQHWWCLWAQGQQVWLGNYTAKFHRHSMQFGVRIPELKSGPNLVQHVNILHRQITNTPHWLLELFHSLSQLARIQISQINDLKFLEFGTQTMCSFEKKKHGCVRFCKAILIKATYLMTLGKVEGTLRKSYKAWHD